LTARAECQQRLDHPARCAASPEDEYPIVGDGEAEILAKVGDQSVAVGVVAEQGVIVIQDQRIDGTGAVGAGSELIGQLRRGFLVWYGHVQPTSATGEEFQHLGAEVSGRDIVETIDDGLIRLFGEQPVDERRPAVIDRMTDHPVLIRCVHRNG
jgi:hypothetical protein